MAVRAVGKAKRLFGKRSSILSELRLQFVWVLGKNPGEVPRSYSTHKRSGCIQTNTVPISTHWSHLFTFPNTQKNCDTCNIDDLLALVFEGGCHFQGTWKQETLCHDLIAEHLKRFTGLPSLTRWQAHAEWGKCLFCAWLKQIFLRVTLYVCGSAIFAYIYI